MSLWHAHIHNAVYHDMYDVCTSIPIVIGLVVAGTVGPRLGLIWLWPMSECGL